MKNTFCSSRNFSSFSEEEKFSSLDTALHFRIFFGTRAERRAPKSEQNRGFQLGDSRESCQTDITFTPPGRISSHSGSGFRVLSLLGAAHSSSLIPGTRVEASSPTFVFDSRNREVLGALPQHFPAFCIAQIHPVSDPEVKKPHTSADMLIIYLFLSWQSHCMCVQLQQSVSSLTCGHAEV